MGIRLIAQVPIVTRFGRRCHRAHRIAREHHYNGDRRRLLVEGPRAFRVVARAALLRWRQKLAAARLFPG
jgi:hypothetical protein